MRNKQKNSLWLDIIDGELSEGEAADRKRKRSKLLKHKKEERRRAAMISKVSESQQTPKAATALARAIQEYVKMLLGVPRGSPFSESPDETKKLPDPPTIDEQGKWLNRERDHQDYIQKAIDSEMKKYMTKKKKKTPDFKPNRKQIRTVEKDAAEYAMQLKPLRPVPFLSRISMAGSLRYDRSWGTQCEAELAIAGFPRCTFDWASKLDSPWNSAMSKIILQQWEKCYEARGATRFFGIVATENTPANRVEILRRWCENQASKYRDQTRRIELVKTPEGKKQVAQINEINQSRVRRRRAQSNVSKMVLYIAHSWN